MLKVFVTDAGNRNATAVIRSLGEKGIHVVAGAPSADAGGLYSRYCGDRVVYPAGATPREFIYFLASYLEKNPVDALIPVSYFSNLAVSQFQSELSRCSKLAIADWNSMLIASRKTETVTFAQSLGIEVPQTYASWQEVNRFPVVVKPSCGSGVVRYVNNREELRKTNTENAIIQEYISGVGYGFYALFNHGEMRAMCMHRRIREYPVTGGPSTAAETVYDQDLLFTGARLLKSLMWHGVAMVEFKKDAADGKYKLIEINPKFWGSLDLCIAAGVDFPWLLAKMATEGDVDPALTYKVGKRFEWVFDDILRLIARPRDVLAVWHDLFCADVSSDVRLNDLKPNLIYGARSIGRVPLRLANRYPHGLPVVTMSGS